MWERLIQSIEDLNRQKGWIRWICSDLTAWVGTLLFSSIWIQTEKSPIFDSLAHRPLNCSLPLVLLVQTSDSEWNYSISSPGLAACQLQILELLHFHNHMSQVLIVCMHAHPCIFWLYFSGEAYLIWNLLLGMILEWKNFKKEISELFWDLWNWLSNLNRFFKMLMVIFIIVKRALIICSMTQQQSTKIITTGYPNHLEKQEASDFVSVTFSRPIVEVHCLTSRAYQHNSPTS